jgi:hypothetical protein
MPNTSHGQTENFAPCNKDKGSQNGNESTQIISKWAFPFEKCPHIGQGLPLT